MTIEKLEKEARDYLRVQTQLNGGGLFSCNVKNLLIGFAEPREKRIEELENQIADIKANCDLAIEGRDIKIKELEQENAGLKAGRPQWHDLRKDPNDLPKDKEYVLVYTNLTNYYVAEKVENHFMSKGWGFIPMSTVIAWCEIPTFDKE